MTAKNDVLKFVVESLHMAIEHVGPNVFSYDFDTFTPGLLPYVIVKIEEAEASESSTFRKVYRNIGVSVGIHVSSLYDDAIEVLYAVRKSVSTLIENGAKPATIIDFNELGASEIEEDLTTERSLLIQTIGFNFLTRETDH